MNKKKIRGKVIGLKNSKTATVEVTTLFLHPKYLKPIKKKSKFQVHNEEYELQLGDEVLFEKSKTYSASKHFRITEKLNE